MEPGLWELLARLQPKYRLKYVWEKAKSTFVCAETDPADEDNPMPIGHNGCGHRQPLIRKEGLKMFTVDKRVGEEEDSKKKKVRSSPARATFVTHMLIAAHTGIHRQEGPAKPATDKHFYSAFDCYNLLKKIPADDMDAMGLSAEFARPEWMILTVLPVPPAPVRPSVASPGKASAQDDLTYKLAEIIKANGSVEKAEQEGSPQYIINNFVELLQVCYFHWKCARRAKPS